MRWVRYSADGKTGYGLLEGDSVEDVLGGPFGPFRRSGPRRPLGSVKIEIPVIPPTFYTAGINYSGHARETAESEGKPLRLPKAPDVNYRSPSALIAHGEAIAIPKDASDKVQYEGELVVVIGKLARRVHEKEALSYVLGYTIGNDISERTWQATDRTLWRAKNADTFKPMGPWIETEVDLDRMSTTVRVNGTPMISFRTNDMLFGIAEHISRISRYVTLHPGDILWMGTDGIPSNIKPGDEVEVEIGGIGTLRNPVVAGS